MTGEGLAQDVGCPRCWPAEAEAAWRARATLDGVAELVDESHFHVLLLACSGCGQRFVSTFSESVDWLDGDDPQYWMLLPVSAPEASALSGKRPGEVEAALAALEPVRRCLRYDHPKAAPGRSYWSAGPLVAPHD